MTKEEFEVLQLDLQQSGKPLMSYLKDAGVKYSTYTYWRRKMEYEHKPEHPIAPISLTQSPGSVFTGTVSSGATLLFPNAYRFSISNDTKQNNPAVPATMWVKCRYTEGLLELH